MNTWLPSLSTKMTGLVTRSLINWLPFTALSNAVRVALSRPTVILPWSSLVIKRPFLGVASSSLASALAFNVIALSFAVTASAGLSPF